MTALEPDADAPVRERTYGWTDPLATAAAAAETDGLTFLRRLSTGELPPPPIATTLGFTLREVEHGRVVFVLERVGEHLYNPIGSVHGGFAATLLDSVCGCAVQTTLPAGVAYTSLDLNVSFLRGMTSETGRVTAQGRVTKPGSRAAFVEADIKDAAGRLIATATSTCLVFTP